MENLLTEYSITNILGKKIAIVCKDQKQWDECCKIMEKHNYHPKSKWYPRISEPYAMSLFQHTISHDIPNVYENTFGCQLITGKTFIEHNSPKSTEEFPYKVGDKFTFPMTDKTYEITEVRNSNKSLSIQGMKANNVSSHPVPYSWDEFLDFIRMGKFIPVKEEYKEGTPEYYYNQIADTELRERAFKWRKDRPQKCGEVSSLESAIWRGIDWYDEPSFWNNIYEKAHNNQISLRTGVYLTPEKTIINNKNTENGNENNTTGKTIVSTTSPDIRRGQEITGSIISSRIQRATTQVGYLSYQTVTGS